VNRLYAVPIILDGRGATVLVDTGATKTVLSRESALTALLTPRSVAGGQTRGVGGGVSALRRVPGVAVQRGGTTATVDVTLGGADSSCGPDGLIGMDALRQCSMMLSESAMTWSCADGR
jgi:predicted aspartyl protease